MYYCTPPTRSFTPSLSRYRVVVLASKPPHPTPSPAGSEQSVRVRGFAALRAAGRAHESASATAAAAASKTKPNVSGVTLAGATPSAAGGGASTAVPANRDKGDGNVGRDGGGERGRRDNVDGNNNNNNVGGSGGGAAGAGRGGGGGGGRKDGNGKSNLQRGGSDSKNSSGKTCGALARELPGFLGDAVRMSGCLRALPACQTVSREWRRVLGGNRGDALFGSIVRASGVSARLRPAVWQMLVLRAVSGGLPGIGSGRRRRRSSGSGESCVLDRGDKEV